MAASARQPFSRSEVQAGSVGGVVTVTNNGSITTHGNDSIGILAQSIGGGGGNGAGAVAAGIFERDMQRHRRNRPDHDHDDG